ncbi:MAG TPA: hypothetical protein VGF92_02905 [Stellaceae bacterium]
MSNSVDDASFFLAARELKRAEKRASLAGFVVSTSVLACALLYDHDWRLGHLVWDAIAWLIIFGSVSYALRAWFIEHKLAASLRRADIDAVRKAITVSRS